MVDLVQFLYLYLYWQSISLVRRSHALGSYLVLLRPIAEPFLSSNWLHALCFDHMAAFGIRATATGGDSMKFNDATTHASQNQGVAWPQLFQSFFSHNAATF